MARKGALAFGAPLPSPGLQPIRTDLIHARHLGHTLSRVELAHDGNLQFAGILLSGHKHCSPPFNVIGPLNSCLTFGVQSKSSVTDLKKRFATSTYLRSTSRKPASWPDTYRQSRAKT